MIYLHSVSKTVFPKHEAPKLVFRPTSIAVPTDRRVAILGDRGQGKTTLLRLLAGVEAPDAGEVNVLSSLSPIGNSKALFHPRLSGTENIRLIARMAGIDAHQLTITADALCGLGADIAKPVATLTGPKRQLLELAVMSVMSFDCYLLDDAFRILPSVLERYLNAAARRGSGVIFTTILPRQVLEYAEYTIVIRNSTARAFSKMEEAIEAYERKSA